MTVMGDRELSYAGALQVIDGLMLGDAGLARRKGGAYFHIGLSKQLVPHSKHSELADDLSLREHLKYLQWIKDNVFRVLDIPVSDNYPKPGISISKGEPYQYARLCTLQSPVLTALYDKWYFGGEWAKSGKHSDYIHEAVKVIPRYLTKTSMFAELTLAHLFLNDGSSSWECHEPWAPGLVVTISVHNFSEEEVGCLTIMLNNMGIHTRKPARSRPIGVGKGSHLQIRIASDSINQFMDSIEPSVLKIFGDSESPSYKDMIKHKTTPTRPYRARAPRK